MIVRPAYLLIFTSNNVVRHGLRMPIITAIGLSGAPRTSACPRSAPAPVRARPSPVPPVRQRPPATTVTSPPIASFMITKAFPLM